MTRYRKKDKQDKWVITSWLNDFDLHDPFQLIDFETNLQYIIRSYQQNNVQAAQEAYDRLAYYAHMQLPIASARQFARLWYKGAQLATAAKDWESVIVRLKRCKEYIQQDDWFSLLQIARLRGPAENMLNRRKEAIDTYSWILEQRPHAKKIPFRVGTYGSFFCNVLLQRSQAQLAEGWIDTAIVDVQDAIKLLNQWILRHVPVRQEHNLSRQDFGTPLGIEGTLIVSIHLIEPQSLLQTKSRDILNWFDMYLYLPWQYAMARMWQYKLEPETIAAPNMWRLALQTVQTIAVNGEDVIENREDIARMHVFSAEFALAICEHLDDPLDWEPYLTEADAYLANARAKGVLASDENDRFLFWLTSLLWEARSAMMAADDAALRHLLGQLKEVVKELRKTTLDHSLGRCLLVLGEIYEALEDDPFHASKHYNEALDVFSKEGAGHFLRAEEARHNLDRLRES